MDTSFWGLVPEQFAKFKKLMVENLVALNLGVGLP
jgi:hypothetical protein